MAVFLATATKSGPRPFVPLRIEYRCPTCGGAAHESAATALVDSGATRANLPASALPDHVRWEDLPPVNATHRSAYRRELAARLWHADLRVLGVRIASEVLVLEPGSAVFPYAVLGTGDLFEHFAVGFAFHNVPPVFSLERLGQILHAPPALAELPATLFTHYLPADGAHELLPAGPDDPEPSIA